MKNKTLLLLKYIHRFGFCQGLKVFVLLKILESQEVKLKKYPKIFLRKHTTDLDVFNQILVNREYNLTEDIKPKFIIDAGANIGLTSLFFADKYPDAKIFAIEPEKENYNMLLKNCSQKQNIIPINKALWYNNEPVFFAKSNSKNSHFVSGNNENGELVETICISALIDQYAINKLDILKIDIEGAEKDIFSKNADEWLPKVKYLLIELHDRFFPGCSASVFKALAKYNFSTKVNGELLIFDLKA
jgi:FkbM family methyltransferase